MRSAREVAHAQESYYEDCPGPRLPQHHSSSCDRLTAAIEQDRRDVIEACAKEADERLEHWRGVCQRDVDAGTVDASNIMSRSEAATIGKRIRALAPPNKETKRG